MRRHFLALLFLVCVVHLVPGADADPPLIPQASQMKVNINAHILTRFESLASIRARVGSHVTALHTTDVPFPTRPSRPVPHPDVMVRGVADQERTAPWTQAQREAMTAGRAAGAAVAANGGSPAAAANAAAAAALAWGASKGEAARAAGRAAAQAVLAAGGTQDEAAQVGVEFVKRAGGASASSPPMHRVRGRRGAYGEAARICSSVVGVVGVAGVAGDGAGDGASATRRRQACRSRVVRQIERARFEAASAAEGHIRTAWIPSLDEDESPTVIRLHIDDQTSGRQSGPSSSAQFPPSSSSSSPSEASRINHAAARAFGLAQGWGVTPALRAHMQVGASYTKTYTAVRRHEVILRFIRKA